MKTLGALAALTLFAGTATASEAPAARTPLRGADCLQPSQINDWRIVDDRTAVVRSGPRYFQINLAAACPQLKQPPGLMFRTNATAGADQGRICGGIGESVHSRGTPACAIQSITLIDKARFTALSDQADAEDMMRPPTPTH